MSDCIHKYPSLVSTWDGYPRVHYFRGRFLDLNTRFKRITGALPKVLHDEEMMGHIEEFKNKLENKYVNITVFGKENLYSSDLYVENPEDIKCDSHPPCLTVIICYATIDGFDERALHEIMEVILYASRSTFLKSTMLVDFLLIVCKTKTSFPETEITKFSTDLQRLVHRSNTALENMFEIVISVSSDLKDPISAIYERRIMNAFSCIHSYLSLFVKSSTHCVQNKMSVMADESIHQRLRDYLRNGFSMADINKATFLSQLIDRLARVVKCTIIPPMSSKYVLPPWLCNRLLHEIQFEEVLTESVSANTKYNLGKLERINMPKISSKEVQFDLKSRSSKLPSYSSRKKRDFLVQSVQNDFKDTATKAEKIMSSMGSLTTVMRKMMFEIKGYMKQTTILDVDTLFQTTSSINIPDGLRQDILLIQGVYGMGTIYDQLEIHVEEHNEAMLAEMMERLKILTKRHRFLYPYTIRCIKE